MMADVLGDDEIRLQVGFLYGPRLQLSRKRIADVGLAGVDLGDLTMPGGLNFGKRTS